MKILVLGGTGYLGSKVCNALLERSHDLFITRRFMSDTSQIQNNERCTFVSASNESIVCLKNENIEMLVNLSCNYGRDKTSYKEVLESNLFFPLNVMSIAVDMGIKKVLAIGTSLPIDLNMYSFSKGKFGEFGKQFVKECDISFAEIELEMFYGSDEPEDRFLTKTIRNCIMGNELDVTLGTQKRDIIDVCDVVDAIVTVAENMPVGYSKIPVGTGISPTVHDVIEYIYTQTESKSAINWGKIPMRSGEPDCCCDVSKISGIFNIVGKEWNPIKWQIGLKDVIVAIKERM